MTPEWRETTDGHDLEARYANCLQVGHNAFEFVINFGQLYEVEAEGRIHTRIITSPVYMKAFIETLVESMRRYESQFGEALTVRDGNGNAER